MLYGCPFEKITFLPRIDTHFLKANSSFFPKNSDVIAHTICLVENETEIPKVSFLFAQSNLSVVKTFNKMISASHNWVGIDAMIDLFSNL
jgi:hypothetical protein